MQTFRTITRPATATLAAVAGSLLLAMSAAGAQPESTLAPLTCADVAGTPAAMGHGDHDPAHMSTPDDHGDHGAAHDATEFDLLYIDMMVPHHESVIALAKVAVSELTHPDLIAMAEAIIATQDAEIAAMHELRDAWYPDAPPVSMDEMMSMPGMGDDMMLMDQVMSAEWQVQAFCAADDKDLAFIEQVIPHHQMAIDTSEAALELAVHPELVAVAELVIEAQAQEIAELERIRAELTGATPAS